MQRSRASSFRPDLDNGNRVGLQVDLKVLGILQRSSNRGDCIWMLQRCGIHQPGADRVQTYDGILGSVCALELYEQGGPLRSIVDRLDHDPAAVRARRGDGLYA